MTRNVRRHLRGRTLAALMVWGALAPGLANARPNDDPGAQSIARIDSRPGLMAASWTVQDNGQLAAVGAGNGEPGVFAGMQCDPFDPASHRLIFGAAHTPRNAELVALFRNPGAKLMISTHAPTLSAQFDIYPEDRGHSTFHGQAEFAAAYLSEKQFDVLNTAQNFVIRAGTHSYSFTGAGSTRAIGAMTCRAVPHHVATRLIESRRDDAAAQELKPWRLAFHAGLSAYVKGRAEAYTSTTNHPANAAASFRIGVSCADRQLYAHLDVGINPAATDDATLTRTNAFIRDFERHGKLVEIYRAGQRLAAFMVDSDDAPGRGHVLSAHDLASLMEADALAVVGDNKVIEFSTANAAASLNGLAKFCGKTG